MLQNNTQNILLQNQLFLAQLQQNNPQALIIPNQLSLVQLQQNNRQPLLIPNQQPLVQIQQNSRQPAIMPSQSPLLNSQKNIPQQTIISNQAPLIKPQINSIQPSKMPNQIPLVQPKINNIQPGAIPNQTILTQPQLNSIQPAIKTPLTQQKQNNLHSPNMQIQQSFEKLNQNDQTNISETNANLIGIEYLQSIINELKESEYAEIEYSRGLNLRKVFKSIYNFHPAETFEIYLGKGEDKKNSFICTEVSTSFQRYCVGTSKREFDMDIFYNISEDEVEFTKDPILKIHRIEGGCCSDRGIMKVYYPDNKKLIGIIIQAILANIYDSDNQLLYRVKLPFELEHKSCFQKFCECIGCKKKEEEEEEKRDYNTFLIKKLVEKEEQVEDIIVKKNVQIIVGKMENYPLKIIFPVDASPKEKMLLIICRIFLLYMMNFSETLREKWYETCKDIAVDIVDAQDQGILGRINNIKEYEEKIQTIGDIYDTFQSAGNNKNIVSLNNYLDD